MAVLVLLNTGIGISINANENENDNFLTEPISTPWNVNNDEDKEVAVIEFVDEHMNESIPGHKTTTTKLLYILKDGTEITVAVTVSSEAITVVYYDPESEFFLLEKYKNDLLVQSLDLSGAFSAKKEELIPAGIPEYNTEMTEFGWGYSFSVNTRSYACASSLVLDGTYDRRNIEIYPNEAKNEQEEFSASVYKIQVAERKLKEIPLDLSYDGLMYLLGDIIGASYGNLADMLENIKSAAEIVSAGGKVYDLSVTIAEESEGLYDLFAILHTYDHLN